MKIRARRSLGCLQLDVPVKEEGAESDVWSLWEKEDVEEHHRGAQDQVSGRDRELMCHVVRELRCI